MKRPQLYWLDYIKAIALVWIFLNHVSEQLFGFPYIANPYAGWPPLEARVAQLQPISGYGLLDIPLNLLRYLGWSGDQGVQLFIIISGFGLTWGLMTRQAGKPLLLGPFYRRRAERLYPLWWGAHLLILFLMIGLPFSPGAIDFNYILSFVGIRLTPGTYFYLVPAWWYVGLLIQLYLVYPLLWEGLRRRGPAWLLTVSLAVALPIRALGLFAFEGYLDQWQRGAIFITRLPEFALGISLAAWFYQSAEITDRRLRATSTVAAALAVYVLGTLLSLTLPGMTIAPLMLGAASLVILYALLRGSNLRAPQNPTARFWTWVGQHSYSLYLIHHLAILIVLPTGIAPDSARALIGIALAVALTLIGAVGLEWGVSVAERAIGSLYRRAGLAGKGVYVTAFGLVVLAGLMVGAELLVRQVAPQEVYGWGERASLEPHSTFGWRLKPSSVTHLRWVSYDYTVTANSLGFPGPEYPQEKPAHAFRILTIGDAFTSAEGVNTEQAWPRLLESALAAQMPDREVQVLNFGITGYGPNQYAAVIEAYAPTYEPDLIIIGFFVNDYQDVLLSDDDFRASIGFDQPPQDGLLSILNLSHLRQFVKLQVVEPLREWITGQPGPNRYFLGQFGALERNRADLDDGQQRVADRLEQIKAVADKLNARVVLAMIPAPVQVCKPDQLNYYPRGVDLSNTDIYDLETPQRATKALADSLGLGYYDLLPVLQAGDGTCVYQPNNLHWTVNGHRAVAAYLAEALVADGYVPSPKES